MDFQVPKITHEEVNENRGVFVIEPLDRGFGYTFGNSLRRVLLSSLEGAAVTSVKIEGVAHEFTTLPGVREDVTDIILNLKQLVCILHGESPEIEVRLDEGGEGVVTAADIEAPADLEILNPELEIANLSSKGRLEMTLTIGRGRGYVAGRGQPRPGAHDRRHPGRLDLLAGPPRRVRRRGRPRRAAHRLRQAHPRRHDDGSIDPKDAIGAGGRDPDPPARDLHRPRADRGLRRERRAAADGGAEPAAVSLAHGMENFPIEELELGVRSYNCLKRVGIETIGDLVTKTESRARRDPELRQEVDRGGQGDAAQHGLNLRGGWNGLGGLGATVRHARTGKKLGRDSAHRKALYANLTGALIEHGRIRTTVTKAKAVKPLAEQMITLGRRGDLHARRQAPAFLRSQDVVHKLFAEVAPRFEERPGGYTRIVKIGPRAGRRGRDGLPRARRRGVRRQGARSAHAGAGGGRGACRRGACRRGAEAEADEEAPAQVEEQVPDTEPDDEQPA